MKSQLPRFRLGTLLICVTLLCFWLGYQMRWLQQRREALIWIREHETEQKWSLADPSGATVTTIGGTPVSYEARPAPFMVWLLGEREAHFIHLDKAKLSSADYPTLSRLQNLFPEAKGIHIKEPGWSHRWTPGTHAEILEWDMGSPGS